MLSPVSVTGTTDCPYAGMVLAIDGKQEIDGTMHLVLAKKADGGSGRTTTFTCSRIPVTGDATETMEAGHEYSIGGTSGTLTFDVGSMQLGEESLVIVPASGPSVKISGQTLNAGTTYLIRRASYIASASSTPSAAAERPGTIRPAFFILQCLQNGWGSAENSRISADRSTSASSM